MKKWTQNGFPSQRLLFSDSLLEKQYIENQDDYLPLPEKYDFNEYRIMEKFIAGIPIEEQSEILFQSIKGKGAFRHFKITLERFALVDKWYAFEDKRLREFVEYWCEENEIEFE